MSKATVFLKRNLRPQAIHRANMTARNISNILIVMSFHRHRVLQIQKRFVWR